MWRHVRRCGAAYVAERILRRRPRFCAPTPRPRGLARRGRERGDHFGMGGVREQVDGGQPVNAIPRLAK